MTRLIIKKKWLTAAVFAVVFFSGLFGLVYASVDVVVTNAYGGLMGVACAFWYYEYTPEKAYLAYCQRYNRRVRKRCDRLPLSDAEMQDDGGKSFEAQS